MNLSEYQQHDALGLAELVKKGEITEKELLQLAIEATEQLNPNLNAVIHTFYDRARKQIQDGLPEGPFKGVPFLLKDLHACFAGEPITMGSRGINWIPEFDNTLVKRLKATGLNIFGKTNTPEYGLIITTEPKAHGPTHNPHKRGYSSGGSSGGSAAAVAGNIVPMAHANDSGGSIRFPAAWCGAYGLKPTRGRNPAGPLLGEDWAGAFAEHAITRSVRDSAALLQATQGGELNSPFIIDPSNTSYLEQLAEDSKPLKIALTHRPLISTTVDPEVVTCLEQTAAKLETFGHHVEIADPIIDRDRIWRSFVVVVAGYVAATEQYVKEKFGPRAARLLEPQTRNIAMIGRSLSAKDMMMALDDWQLIRRQSGEFMQNFDIMLCPTVPICAVKHGTLTKGVLEEWVLGMSSHINLGKLSFKLGLVDKLALPVLETMAFTLLGNITGIPAVSMPMGRNTAGLPIGIQAYAKLNREDHLFTISSQLESDFILD